MNMDQFLLSLKTSGFCIIEDVIPPDNLASVISSIKASVAKESANYATGLKGISFIPSLIVHDQSFAPYLADERILKLAEILFGDHVRISFTSAIVNQPGNDRGLWHADWPFNQKNAGHIPAPYPDALMHLTTLWMLTPFTAENGGTLVLPGSHHHPTNPTAKDGVDPKTRFPSEVNAEGPAGSVLVFDSRLWHCTSPNRSQQARYALAVRYAPWWLNLEVLRPESDERKRMVDEPGGHENRVPSIPQKVFEELPDRIKPLYRHWVAR